MNRGFLSRLLALVLPIGLLRFHVEGEGGGGGEGSGGKGGSDPNPNESRETFSGEYVRELRAENKGWRLKAQQLEQDSNTHKAAAEKAAAEAELKVKEANSAADQRIIRAELKTAALKAGMVDLDGLKLADLSSVTLNEQGEVEGADALMEALKKAKPFLFANSQNSSTPENPPNPKPGSAKNAKDMTDEEYERARKQFK